jgi:hypothetical protein
MNNFYSAGYSARWARYGDGYVPNYQQDGTHIGHTNWGTWQTVLTNRLAVPSPVEIEVSHGGYDGDERTGDLHAVVRNTSGSTFTANLFVALVEDNISSGRVYDGVLRQFFTGTAGQTINVSPGDSHVYDLSYDFDTFDPSDVMNEGELEFIVFAQYDTSRFGEIYQTDFVKAPIPSVVQPYGGSFWWGEDIDVVWTPVEAWSADSSVVSHSVDGGTFIRDGVVIGTDTTFTTPCPTVNSTDVRFRVDVYSGAYSSSNVSEPTTARGNYLVYPNGFQSFAWDSTVNVWWIQTPYVPRDSTIIELSTDGGSTWSRQGSVGSDTFFVWSVPHVISTDCYIDITFYSGTASALDESNAHFTIYDPSGVPGEYAGPELPVDAILEPPFPNPFNPATCIAFILEDDALVSLDVYDMLGRPVATLAEGPYSAGRHVVTWNAIDLPSGTYLIRLTAGNKTTTRRATLIK